MCMSNNESVTVETKNGPQQLKKTEYARWLCLLEAMDLIEQKGKELKMDMTTDDFWVKPLAFQKYIDQRLETMLLDVEREEFKRGLDSGIIPVYKDEDVVEEEQDEEPVMDLVPTVVEEN